MFKFDNSYLTLPEAFYAQVQPAWVPQPELLEYNHELAEETLGLDRQGLDDAALAKIFSGQSMPDGASSIACAYAGHQFGHLSPQLGDGRALLMGEVLNKEGQRYDIQLKGSGQTPFSRNGDGKSSLGPVIREYIVSEAMHHLHVPTTRALAAVKTGEPVYREDALPGGIFTRVASSHIRIGTFEYFAVRQDWGNLKKLVDYAIARHYSEIDKADPDKYLVFLEKVAERHACMVAQWMAYGFIHGVMNTDNMSISGETIDYGPCAYMDNFSFDKVFSSIDHSGRYAYQNQIPIARWNLTRLASCLIPLIDDDEKKSISKLEKVLDELAPVYESKVRQAMGKKFGIFEVRAEDDDLIHAFLSYLESEELDFTLSFRTLTDQADQFGLNPQFNKFHQSWQHRLQEQSQLQEESHLLMQRVNPVYIARNHQVENAIEAAIEGDLTIFKEMTTVLKKPFEAQLKFEKYRLAPEPDKRVQATFCGT
jgi:uncharacterized protein YdiU (UPF0061 family)